MWTWLQSSFLVSSFDQLHEWPPVIQFLFGRAGARERVNLIAAA
jgi:hypothetical protein